MDGPLQKLSHNAMQDAMEWMLTDDYSKMVLLSIATLLGFGILSVTTLEFCAMKLLRISFTTRW